MTKSFGLPQEAIEFQAQSFDFESVLSFQPIEYVSYGDYFRGSIRSHLTGIAGGMIWCIGMSFSIIASGKAGPAISYGLGQGATVIAALWGIFVWKEFSLASKETTTLLYSMLVCYLIGLILIIASR